MECPYCKGTNLSRRYASFYVSVDKNGEDKANNFSDHQSSTELSEDAICDDCQAAFEWED